MEYSYDRVDAEAVRLTAEVLRDRIGDRFPSRGLHNLSIKLVKVITEVEQSPERIRSRRPWLTYVSWIGIGTVLLIAVSVMVLAVRSAVIDAPDSGLEWLSVLESGVNDVVFAAIAIWFLFYVPERFQRDGLLDLLHRLRSLAHVVDMHQLTKSPERLAKLDLDKVQLKHYLDYCSELLSIIGKTAALCAEESRDPIVRDTVSTIETLTVSLERKIWQKIAVVNDLGETGAAT